MSGNSDVSEFNLKAVYNQIFVFEVLWEKRSKRSALTSYNSNTRRVADKRNDNNVPADHERRLCLMKLPLELAHSSLFFADATFSSQVRTLLRVAVVWTF